jgi:lipopolysaccharide/colanic/teichoic acid biosynthesis glycosyltransferase
MKSYSLPRPTLIVFAALTKVRRWVGAVLPGPRRRSGRDHRPGPTGITGWVQVRGPHGDPSLSERVRFDNQYIEYGSPWLDAVVLALTLAAAIRDGRRCGR